MADVLGCPLCGERFTHSMDDPRIRESPDGSVIKTWKVNCPGCGHVLTVEDHYGYEHTEVIGTTDDTHKP
ncbi:MAG: hypothetical protein E7Z63_01030 [Thermoplasmata archaeon]|nr:hypothetical protein [Thermoplasmata archaeon]